MMMMLNIKLDLDHETKKKVYALRKAEVKRKEAQVKVNLESNKSLIMDAVGQF